MSPPASNDPPESPKQRKARQDKERKRIRAFGKKLKAAWAGKAPETPPENSCLEWSQQNEEARQQALDLFAAYECGREEFHATVSQAPPTPDVLYHLVGLAIAKPDPVEHAKRAAARFDPPRQQLIKAWLAAKAANPKLSAPKFADKWVAQHEPPPTFNTALRWLRAAKAGKKQKK